MVLAVEKIFGADINEGAARKGATVEKDSTPTARKVTITAAENLMVQQTTGEWMVEVGCRIWSDVCLTD